MSISQIEMFDKKDKGSQNNLEVDERCRNTGRMMQYVAGISGNNNSLPPIN